MRVLYVFTDSRAPSVAVVDNVVTIEETVDNDNKPLWTTTTSGGVENTMFKTSGNVVIVWE